MTIDRILRRYFDCGDSDEEPLCDALDFVAEYGDPRQALLLFRLFWPEFIEIDGHVVLKHHVTAETQLEEFRAAILENPDRVDSIVASYRLLVLPEVFDRGGLEPDEYEQLADALLRTWLGALNATFPERRWFTHRVRLPIDSLLGVSFSEDR